MSDLELERSATAPHRWVELCNVSKKQHPNDFSSLPLRAGRNIDLNALTATLNLKAHIHHTKLYLVPGGRYLVASSLKVLFVLDLGCFKCESADCKLIASVELVKDCYFHRSCVVQATRDGMGLIIFLSEA